MVNYGNSVTIYFACMYDVFWSLASLVQVIGKHCVGMGHV